MMRVVYETIESCKECLYNKCGMCYKLSRPLKELCFELDCPLPHLEEVERFTRYITEDKSLDCCGNCKNWKRWHYNEAFKLDVGACCVEGNRVYTCDSEACEEYDEI